MPQISCNVNKTPLTGEERAQLLSRVYAIILSPEWEKADELPKPQPKQRQGREKVHQDEC